MSNSILTHPMSWRGHIRASVVLGLPLIGSHIAQMLTHVTDVVMLGWYDIEALAAVVLASQVYFVIFIVGSGFAFAVMPMCATALGAGEIENVRRSVRMGTWIVLLYGLIMAVPLWYIEPLLLALGQQTTLASLASDYMQIALIGLFPALLIMVVKSYLSALERAQVVLIATLIAALANVLFNYALIFGNLGFPEMGVKGAAIASILTITLDFVFLVFYIKWLPALKQYELFQNPFRFDREAFVETFRLGWPISLTMLAESGLFAAATIMMGWAGTVALAAHGIVLQIASISFMIPLGMSNVATIRTGRAVGRKDATGLWRASVVVCVGSFLIALATMALFITFPRIFIGLFLDPTDANVDQIVEMGRMLLFVAAAFQVADATQVVALGLLRGVKDTAMPMVLAVVSYWVIGMPAAYLLGFTFGFGGQGVWGGLVIGLVVAAITMLWRYSFLLRQLLPKLETQAQSVRP